METFENDYKEPIFDRVSSQNCKVKSNIVIIKTTKKESVKTRVLKNIARVLDFLNIPIKTKIHRLPEYEADFKDLKGNKLVLNKNITSITKKYKNKSIISICTDIDEVFLTPLR